jgi:hypothetical protein
MRLPKAEHAIVDPSKVRDYLLSPQHPVGRFKAAFFSSLGFEAEDWESLRLALLTHARDGEASPEIASLYGKKFRVRGMLQGPNGKTASVVSIWIARRDDGLPRFVTAFPGVAR